MAYSESLAERMRGISEKKMFGGIYFLLNGNMLARPGQMPRTTTTE